MRVVKIGAIWCGGCLVMNKVWNKLLKNYSFDYTELDLDMDEDTLFLSPLYNDSFSRFLSL
jgi:hypothetical protein